MMPQNENVTHEKAKLRTHFSHVRKTLPDLRKKVAAQMLLHDLIDKVAPYSKIVSFWSFNEEINISLFNRYLATTGRLYLPLMTGPHLRIFQVDSLSDQIEFTPSGLGQPVEKSDRELSPSDIDVILVPALAFDTLGYRLGYGQGYYDRFLKSIPLIPSWGIGYAEQLVGGLPIEPTDIPVKSLCLF